MSTSAKAGHGRTYEHGRDHHLEQPDAIVSMAAIHFGYTLCEVLRATLIFDVAMPWASWQVIGGGVTALFITRLVKTLGCATKLPVRVSVMLLGQGSYSSFTL